MKALAKESKRRIPGCGDFIRQLEKGEIKSAPPRINPVPKPKDWNRLLEVSALLVIVVFHRSFDSKTEVKPFSGSLNPLAYQRARVPDMGRHSDPYTLPYPNVLM